MSVSTEKTTIQVSFPKEKLEALKFYMNEKDTTIEKELLLHIKNVYEKYVPGPTRRYLERNDSEAEIQTEVTVGAREEQQNTQTSPTSTRGRRRNTREQSEDINELGQTEHSSVTEETEEQSQEESPSMSMSM